MKTLSKKAMFRGTLLVGAAMAMNGCGGVGALLNLTYAVIYTVEVGAPATVTLIQYTDAGGVTRTVNNPSLPWSIGTTAASGDTIRIRVKGVMSTGIATEFVTAKASATTVGFNKNINKTYRTNTAYDESSSVTLD